MREISCDQITEAVRALCIESCIRLPRDVRALIDAAAGSEPYEPARESLCLLQKNADIAEAAGIPICQDTGSAVVFAEIGQEVHITGGLLRDAVDEGVRRGYTEGYLRKSIAADPLRRVNTGDNTPAVLHTELVSGDRIRLTVSPKGGGSENMSRLRMLTPAQGVEGVVDFVLETVRLAGANPCPPIIVGVGIGGNFEQVALLSKRALIEEREGPHPDPYYAALEDRLLREINALGIGPQGFGGRTTALRVRIRTAPVHITGLPVAVNMGCHVTRHASVEL